MVRKIKEVNKHAALKLLILVFALVLPALLVVNTVLIFKKTSIVKQGVGAKIETSAEDNLNPREILKNKSKYRQKRIILKGKVSLDSVVCERKACLLNDPCCGCPSERNLVFLDVGSVLNSESEQLRLSDEEGKSLCKRQPLSCKYDCGDWIEGGIYEVRGVFFSETPAPGWRYALKHYLAVEDKNLVKRIGLKDLFSDVLSEITQMVRKIKGSSYYILP